MYDSLQTLASMPTGTVVYPGHRYSFDSSATIDSTIPTRTSVEPDHSRRNHETFWMGITVGAQ